MSCPPAIPPRSVALLPLALLLWLTLGTVARADELPIAVDPDAAPAEAAPAEAAAPDVVVPDSATDNAPLSVPEACRGEHMADPRWFDRAQGYFSQRACTPAVWFDRFFGDARAEDVASALVRVIPSIQYSDRDFTDAGVRFKAHVTLPNLKHRFNLVVNDDTDEHAGLLPGEVVRPAQANAPVRGDASAALRYLVSKTGQAGIDADIGLRSQLKVFARLRYYHTWTHTPVLQTRFTQSIFFRDGEGFGETSLYEVERMLADNRMLRWSNQLTATEDLGGAQWRNGLMLLHQLDRDRAISWNAAMTADSEPAWKDSGYFFSVRYRQRVFRSWLFFEIEPFVDGIREDGFNTNPGIAFRVEVWLGDSRDANEAMATPPATEPVDEPAETGAAPELTSPSTAVPTAAP